MKEVRLPKPLKQFVWNVEKSLIKHKPEPTINKSTGLSTQEGKHDKNIKDGQTYPEMV